LVAAGTRIRPIPADDVSSFIIHDISSEMVILSQFGQITRKNLKIYKKLKRSCLVFEAVNLSWSFEFVPK
jgi:hypothetical protein